MEFYQLIQTISETTHWEKVSFDKQVERRDTEEYNNSKLSRRYNDNEELNPAAILR
jgi:hypothetical protein